MDLDSICSVVDCTLTDIGVRLLIRLILHHPNVLFLSLNTNKISPKYLSIKISHRRSETTEICLTFSVLSKKVKVTVKRQVSCHLYRDLVERVDISSATEQSLEQNDNKNDPDVSDEVVVNL